MTYKELIEKLNKLPEERLNDNITVYDSGTDEYVGVYDLFSPNEHAYLLDKGHVFLVMNSNVVVIE
jgi:hypothetical protein